MSMFDSIKNIFSKGEVGVGRSNPLDSMPIANGTNKYATPEKMTELENIVTIISYEEFSDLVVRIGGDEITTMELIDSIAQINSIIYEQTDGFGST